ERAIRPFTIGRKNWVVSGSPVGAAASACLYSFIETAKANNCEPYHYLRYIFDRLPTTPHDKLESLLPWNIDIRSIILAYSRSDAELSVKLNEQNQ
ncbi:MAG: transposase domain-containing protein, partial [candidate division WOR-3 bacterium]